VSEEELSVGRRSEPVRLRDPTMTQPTCGRRLPGTRLEAGAPVRQVSGLGRIPRSLEGWTDDPSSEAGAISGFTLGLKQVCLLDEASKLLERVIAASLEEDLSKVLSGL
jgi:hypothetical protein